MTSPVRLQLSRRKGFNLQEHSRAVNGLPAVNVARPSRWGNPHLALRTWQHGGYPRLGIGQFRAATACDAEREGARIAVAMFRDGWEAALAAPNRAAREALQELRGKNLACWCKPGSPCHADVLLDLANRPDSPGGRDE